MNAIATIAPAGGAAGPQYMRALERANKVRLARADLKRRVATGETSVAEVVLECPWEAESMTVADLLMSQRRWGTSRCRKFLARQINPPAIEIFLHIAKDVRQLHRVPHGDGLVLRIAVR